MSMLVGVGMDCAIGMLMLVGVDVRVDLGVQMFVLDLGRHGVFLLWTGEKSGLAGCGHAAIASQQAMNSMPSGEKGPANV